MTQGNIVADHGILARAAAPRAIANRACAITVMRGGEITYWMTDGISRIPSPPDRIGAIQLRVFDLSGGHDQILEQVEDAQ